MLKGSISPLCFQNNSAELEHFPSIWCKVCALTITVPVKWCDAACLRLLGILSVSLYCSFSCYSPFCFSVFLLCLYV